MVKDSQKVTRDHTLHHVGSISALKMLGKKILNSKNHEQSDKAILVSSERPKSSSPRNRERSSSLFPRNKSNVNVPAVTAMRSSASIHNMVAHNNNPFAHGPGAEVKSSGKGIAPRRNGSGAGTNHSINRRPSGNLANNHHFLNNENIIYNPYGINGNVVPSRPGTAYNNNENTDISFYMHDGNSKIRLLPLPIADPNEFLPEEMKEVSIHLSDNFVFDSENKTLGTGGSSEVRKIRSAYRQKDVYALKKLNMIYDESAEKFYKRCSKEFIIAKHLSHNINVCNTYYLLKVPTTTYTTRGWGFVMEFCVKDLFQLMERSGWKAVPLSEKFCIFKQISNAIKFCHEQGVAHRDLKPENVLISKEGICKLTDFGISDWYHVEPHNFDSPVRMCEGMIGSPPYTPPEVMVYDAKKHFPESAQKPYNPLKMDSYALGLILIALVNNILPFFESCNTDPRFRDFEISYENYISHQNTHFRDKGYHKAGPGSEYTLARNFKSTDASRVAWRLADPNPNTRYSIDDLFDDPWFQAIEVCVDDDDEHIFKPPEIRKSSSETPQTSQTPSNSNSISDFFHSEQEQNYKDGADHLQHTSNPFLNTKARPKPRSMVDIAQSPVKLDNVAAKVPTKVEEEEDEEAADVSGVGEKEIPEKSEKNPDGLTKESEISQDEKEHVDAVQKELEAYSKGPEAEQKDSEAEQKDSEADSRKPENAKSDVPTERKELEEPSKTNLTSQKTLQSQGLEQIQENNIIAPAPSTPARKLSELSLSSSGQNIRSIRDRASSNSLRSSGPARRKKHPIHNHLDIPGSITSSSSSRTYSNRT